MKKGIALLIVLSIVLTSLFGLTDLNTTGATAAPSIISYTLQSAVVTASYLNVREGASTSYRVVCVLKKGQMVKVFAKMGDWYGVYDPAGGCVGAVSGKYIRIIWPSRTVTTPSPTPSPATTAPTPGPTAEGVSQDEQTMLNLVNKARADAGVGPLAFDMDLQKVARLKAKDMVDNNYFDHQSPTYGSPFDMMRNFGISFRSAGENIAGYSSVDGAFKGWMSSPDHKANILNSKFNLTGIGIVSSPKYGKIFVQQFIGR